MVGKDTLKRILLEGRRLSSQRYYEHCRINHVKTFYFFCDRLRKEPPDAYVSSTELNDYILAELRRRNIAVTNQFNPQGWFGQAWTDWEDASKNESNFKNEGDVPMAVEI